MCPDMHKQFILNNLKSPEEMPALQIIEDEKYFLLQSINFTIKEQEFLKIRPALAPSGCPQEFSIS